MSSISKFDKYKNNLKLKQPHLTLISYNGYKKECEVLDIEYGIFTGIYGNVIKGTKAHKKRSAINKSMSFAEASRRLSDKFDYLTLLTFTTSNNKSYFIDSEYGFFYKTYKNVFSGKTGHPKRVYDNKHNKRTAEVSNKIKKTNLQKYGVANPFESKAIQNKIKETNLQKYGVENPFESKDIQNKIKETNLYTYGVENPMQSELVKAKSEDTCILKYGCKYALQNNDVKNKIKKTNFQRYGVENPLESKDIQNKIKETNLRKYGCEYNLQNRDIINKSKKTKMKLGLIHNIDGYSALEYYRNNITDCSVSTFTANIRHFGKDNAIKFSSKKTNIENAIYLVLKNAGIKFKFNRLLAGTNYRPDFNIKSHNLIVECDGLFYHSDIKQKQYTYHIDKFNSYTDCGYKSLFFREDEILNKAKIVESIIMAKLGTITDRVFARKCKFEMADSKTASVFFENNHLMGRGTGKTYALIYDGEIVSAMRVVNKAEHIEISRFCNKLNTYVLGGFSKLLKQALLSTGKKKVVSFVDMRYGDGHSLTKLGFEEKSNYVSFKWTNFKDTVHRMTFRGNSGYENGWYKIYDCGQKKFELHL